MRGSYTHQDGEVLRNGIWLPMDVAERLYAIWKADPEPYAQELAQEIGAAIRAAWAYQERNAA